MKGLDYKKNHYVPVSYLKRWIKYIYWGQKVKYIFSQRLNEKVIRKVDINNQCQKSNFYTLPIEFKSADRKSIEKAFFGYSDEIYSKAMSHSFDIGKDPSTSDINGLLFFSLYQSFRTPKFKDSTILKIQELKTTNPEFQKMTEDFAYNLSYLLTKVFPLLYDDCLVEILVSFPGTWFLTTDNPSTYWIDEWNNLTYLPTIVGTDFKVSNLKLLIPLNPQVCFLIHLNMIQGEKNYKEKTYVPPFIKRTVKLNEVDLINKSLIEAADKVLYSMDEETLLKYT